jgi:RHS repeat-associated protein
MTLPTRYTFTGQYSYVNDDATDWGGAGFGLMDYRARMYDPALGRFIQADSIVPPGVQGLDRYAYVNNDPVRYTDPSGHICVDINGAAYAGNCHGGGPDVPTPRPNDLDDIDGWRTGTSGNDFYNWYLELWNTRGWWWDMFGQDKDGFTIFDAFAVIFIDETEGVWTNPYISEAAIRDANAWCKTVYGNSCTIGGYINHFAHEYQSAHNYIGGFPLEPNHERWGKISAAAMRRVANSFSSHPLEWNSGCEWLRPCGWGNKSMYSPEAQKLLKDNPLTVFAYYDPEGDTWIIPSKCVIDRWMGGGDPPSFDLGPCENVR